MKIRSGRGPIWGGGGGGSIFTVTGPATLPSMAHRASPCWRSHILGSRHRRRPRWPPIGRGPQKSRSRRRNHPSHPRGSPSETETTVDDTNTGTSQQLGENGIEPQHEAYILTHAHQLPPPPRHSHRSRVNPV